MCYEPTLLVPCVFYSLLGASGGAQWHARARPREGGKQGSDCASLRRALSPPLSGRRCEPGNPHPQSPSGAAAYAPLGKLPDGRRGRKVWVRVRRVEETCVR
eukprot:358308-Chlamydomonas_euryale.AAC.6